MPEKNAYGAGAKRVLDYLASEFDDEGTARRDPDNVQFYYKLPATLCYGATAFRGRAAYASR